MIFRIHYSTAKPAERIEPITVDRLRTTALFQDASQHGILLITLNIWCLHQGSAECRRE